MKKLLSALLLTIVVLGSGSCQDPIEVDNVSSIRSKTWVSDFGIGTKASTIDVEWEQGDAVTVFSVRDGIITYRSDVTVTASWDKEGVANKATITAEIDVNADSYYAYFPATACPLQVGDKYSLSYDADDTWTDIPRLHDLPQYAEVSSTAKSINFEPLTSCFRLSKVRKSKLPIPIKVYVQKQTVFEGKSYTYWDTLYEGVISESTVDLDAHFTRKSLLHISEYYDFCWILPADGTYKVRYKVTSAYLSDPFTLKKGQIADESLYGIR